MNNWSVRLKMTLGVGAAVVLLAFSGGFAFYSLSQNFSLFVNHEEESKNTIFIQQLRYNIIAARMNAMDFLYNGNESKLQNYHNLMVQTKTSLEENLARIQNPESLKMFETTSDLMRRLEGQFASASELLEQSKKQNEVVVAIGEKLETDLAQAIGQLPRNYVDMSAQQALRHLLKTRHQVTLFLKHDSNASADQARQGIESMLKANDSLTKNINNATAYKQLQQISEDMAKYSSAFEDMVALDSRLMNTIGELDNKAPELFNNLAESDQVFRANQAALAEALHDSSSRASMFVSVLTILAMVTISVAGFFVTRAITTPLAQAEKFAMAVANGDFEQSISIGQKDEVGKICDALQSIKETGFAVANEVEGIVAKIEYGNLLAKGDSSNFNGGFANLVEGVNTLVGTFENLIGQLPVGVMTLSTDHKVQYLNAAAMEIADVTSFNDRVCSDLFRSDDCNTKQCATDRCFMSMTQETSEASARPASGEHEIQFSAYPLQTRSGEVSGALELIIDQTKIKRAQKTMLKVAQQANTIADQVASTSEELAAQLQQVSNGAELQQEQVSGTATAMEEMNCTVLEVARNASKASEQSDAAKNKANEGAKTVNQVVDAINQVKTVAEQLQSNMERLGAEAESIGGVMTVISDIADQTNLLALNAAIEAARAGDAGRGFAVVADEVRKLAEKTMEATKDVGDNILSIQSATSESTKRVEDAVDSVARATELADCSGQALADIVHLSTESSDLISSIATAAEQQSATSDEINRAIEDVNRVVGETTTGMVQSSTAVQELAQISLTLKNVLDNLQEG